MKKRSLGTILFAILYLTAGIYFLKFFMKDALYWFSINASDQNLTYKHLVELRQSSLIACFQSSISIII